MSKNCRDCESHQGEIHKLKNEIYNISRSNINSQKLLEEKYSAQIQQLREENHQLKKLTREYEEYKLKSESYYNDVNKTLIVAKSKLKELHERIKFLEQKNNKLESKYNDTKSLLSIMVEHNNYKPKYTSEIPINGNKPHFLNQGQFDANSIST